jgi:hypothetical protein
MQKRGEAVRSVKTSFQRRPRESNIMDIAVTTILLPVRERRAPTRNSIKLLSPSMIF